MKALNFIGWLKVSLTVLLFGLCLIVAALPARAQTSPQCGAWPDVAAALSARYGEAVLFEGEPGPGGPRVVITAKPDGTTWTALSVDPSGLACIRAAGGGWHTGTLPAPTGEQG